MKKFAFGMAVLLGASLFFLGCPTDAGNEGAMGAPGSKGPAFLTGPAVTAKQLQIAFDNANLVTLTETVTTVYGTVPGYGTLVVLGSGTAVAATVPTGEEAELRVEGTVNVYQGAALNASGLSGTAGVIYGSVSGEGNVLLPFVAEKAPEGLLTFSNAVITNKAAGSYWADGSAGAPVAVDASNIPAIFDGGVTELTVYDITGLTAASVPQGATLTLAGTNTAAAALDLSGSSAGTLIVAEGATLTTANAADAIKAKDTSNVTINGTLNLGTTGTLTTGKFVNNGKIVSSATVAATQKALVTLAGLSGTGTLELSGEGAGALDVAVAVALKQDVIVSGTVKAFVATSTIGAPFSGSKTITVTEDGTLDFGAADAALSLAGVTIDNSDGGTVTTATTSDKALATVLGVGGKITSTGAISTLTQALTIPANTELVSSANATFTTGNFAVTVNGKATFTAATFAGLTGVANETIFTVAAGGEAALTAATFANTTVGDIAINGKATFGAAAVPGGNVTVGAAGDLTVAASPGALTLASGKTLTVNGALTVTGSIVGTAGTIVIGNTDKVTLTKAILTKGIGAGATGTLTLANGEKVNLADEGTIVVAGAGKVTLLHSEFGAGTYTAAGAVEIAAGTTNDTIKTAATAEKGLVIGAVGGLSLFANTTTAATYTFTKVDDVKIQLGTDGITVGNETTSNASSVGAPATASIVLGTGAINLGNAATLVLATGAKIGVFSNTSDSPTASGGSIGGAAVSVVAFSNNTSGTLTAESSTTLTGADDGDSSIATGATFEAGT
jgi:filamentous hemagglutinin